MEVGFTGEVASYLVEVVKLHLCHSTSDSGRNGFTSITNKVWHTEDLGSNFICLLLNFKMPGEKKKVCRSLIHLPAWGIKQYKSVKAILQTTIHWQYFRQICQKVSISQKRFKIGDVFLPNLSSQIKSNLLRSP